MWLLHNFCCFTPQFATASENRPKKCIVASALRHVSTALFMFQPRKSGTMCNDACAKPAAPEANLDGELLDRSRAAPILSRELGWLSGLSIIPCGTLGSSHDAVQPLVVETAKDRCPRPTTVFFESCHPVARENCEGRSPLRFR